MFAKLGELTEKNQLLRVKWIYRKILRLKVQSWRENGSQFVKLQKVKKKIANFLNFLKKKKKMCTRANHFYVALVYEHFVFLLTIQVIGIHYVKQFWICTRKNIDLTEWYQFLAVTSWDNTMKIQTDLVDKLKRNKLFNLILQLILQL